MPDDDKKPCPRCKGTGFDRPGHICGCISGEQPDVMEFFKKMFGTEPSAK